MKALLKSLVLSLRRNVSGTACTICNMNLRRLAAAKRFISLAESCRQSCGITLHPRHHCGIDSFIFSYVGDNGTECFRKRGITSATTETN